MTENQNGKFSAKRRAFYIAIAALMGIMTAACILLAISLSDTFGEVKHNRTFNGVDNLSWHLQYPCAITVSACRILTARADLYSVAGFAEQI